MPNDDYMDRCRELIAKYGHMVQYVGGTKTAPGWAYTIGLSSWEHPEVIVFALPPQTAKAILNDLATQVKAGNGVRHGDVREDLLVGLHVTFVDVADTSTDYFNVGRALLPVFRAVQMVFPDAQDRFPWEAGYDLRPEVQPLLNEPSQMCTQLPFAQHEEPR